MSWAEVALVLRALNEADIRYWLQGGWGVDALVGRQTRSHRDLDVDLDQTLEAEALYVLNSSATPWRRLAAEPGGADRPGPTLVDLHPLLLDQDGTVRQAALGGSFHVIPASCFTVGQLGGLDVPCLSAAAQLAFHEGYQLRPVDRHDRDLLERLLDRP